MRSFSSLQKRRNYRLLSTCGSLVHLAAEAQWTHVGPNLIDIGEALGLQSLLTHIAPSGGILTIRRPDRILFFVIDHYFVGNGVLIIGSTHRLLQLICFLGGVH